MAAAVVLVVAAGIITGNLLAAAQIGETVEMLILVAAVVAAVLAAAVLVGAARAAVRAVELAGEVRAAELALVKAGAMALVTVRATTRPETEITGMETTPAIQIPPIPARAVGLMARGNRKAAAKVERTSE
jgi:hypothetical protein